MNKILFQKAASSKFVNTCCIESVKNSTHERALIFAYFIVPISLKDSVKYFC